MKVQSLQETLGALVGDHVRPATESDLVAGVQPQFVVEPGKEEEIAKVLAFADREGLKVLVRGGGTQLNTGLPPTGGDVLLSMARLNTVVEHAPHDMTVTVEAGLQLTDLQAHLARTRQWLALDPALDPNATIGGIISTNLSGARRLRYGGVRDQIIGIRVVLPDGIIAKGGGKVVKNVAGYDLPKLFTGALGTLGVIVAATFRLYPLRAASPTAVDVMSAPAAGVGCVMAARFETEPESADEQAATLVSMTTGLDDNKTLQGEAEEQFWQQVASDFPLASEAENALILKASVLPTSVASWLESLEHTAKEASLSTRWRGHAGHGLIFARLSGEETALARAVDELRHVASAGEGSLVVLDAPVALARKVDVWGSIPAFEIMRRLKARFDPNYTLNPGRFVGGI